MGTIKSVTGIPAGNALVGTTKCTSTSKWRPARVSTISWITQKRTSRIGGGAARRATSAKSADIGRIAGILRGDESVPQRVRHRLGPGRNAQLREHARDVTLDGAPAELEFSGDLLVRPAAGQQGENVGLPRRQPAAGRRRASPPPGEPVGDPAIEHENPIG